MNLKFSYLYRDFSNYKKFNEIVFLNPGNKSVDDVKSFIEKHLIDGRWFYSFEWKVPDLHFDNWDSEDDHFLHEFESIEERAKEPLHKGNTSFLRQRGGYTFAF